MSLRAPVTRCSRPALGPEVRYWRGRPSPVSCDDVAAEVVRLHAKWVAAACQRAEIGTCNYEGANGSWTASAWMRSVLGSCFAAGCAGAPPLLQTHSAQMLYSLSCVFACAAATRCRSLVYIRAVLVRNNQWYFLDPGEDVGPARKKPAAVAGSRWPLLRATQRCSHYCHYQVNRLRGKPHGRRGSADARNCRAGYQYTQATPVCLAKPGCGLLT